MFHKMPISVVYMQKVHMVYHADVLVGSTFSTVVPVFPQFHIWPLHCSLVDFPDVYNAKQSRMPSSDKKKVAVIGAGVVGLSAALKMLELHGDRLEVTIIADRFLQQTLTYSCGGLWEPYQIAGLATERFYSIKI